MNLLVVALVVPYEALQPVYHPGVPCLVPRCAYYCTMTAWCFMLLKGDPLGSANGEAMASAEPKKRWVDEPQVFTMANVTRTGDAHSSC